MKVACAVLLVLVAAQARAEPLTAIVDARELAYRREAIRIGGDRLALDDDSAAATRLWIVRQGEQRTRLPAEDFYRLVERPDLADAYRTRRTWKTASGAVGLVAFVGAGYAAFRYVRGQSGDHSACIGTGALDCIRASDAEARRAASPWGTAAIALAAGSVVTLSIAGYLTIQPHPISMSEAKVLATRHNDRLRRRLGLPTASDVTVAPYAAPDGGGMAVAGRF